MGKIPVWKIIAKISAVRDLVETAKEVVLHVKEKTISDSKLLSMVRKIQTLIEFITGKEV